MCHHTLSIYFFIVSHEAISVANPEILSLVLQHRDFQRGSQRLAGIPELLDELNAVSLFFLIILKDLRFYDITALPLMLESRPSLV